MAVGSTSSGFRELGDGRLGLQIEQQRLAVRHIDGGVGRPPLQHPRVVGHGLNVPAARGADLGPRHDQGDILGIKADGLAQVRERLVEKALGIPRQTAVAIGQSEARIEADGLGKPGDRIVKLLLLDEDKGAKMMALGIGRGESDRRIEVGQSTLPFFLLDPDPSSGLVGLGVLGVGRNLAAEILGPLFQRKNLTDFHPATDGSILGRDIRKAIPQPLNLENSFSPAGDLPLPIAQHGSRFGEHNFRPDTEIRTGRCRAGCSPARREAEQRMPTTRTTEMLAAEHATALGAWSGDGCFIILPRISRNDQQKLIVA